MAGFNKYGDPFKKVEEVLGALNADAAQLEREAQGLGATQRDLEKARAKMEQQAGRGPRVGRGAGDITEGQVTRGARTNRAEAERALQTEQRLTAQRQESLRLIQRQNQIGPYAYSRSLKNQASQLEQVVNLQRKSLALQQPFIGRGAPPPSYGGPGGRGAPLALPPGQAPIDWHAREEETLRQLQRRGLSSIPVGAPAGPTADKAGTSRAAQEAERLAQTYGKATAGERDWTRATQDNLSAQATASRGMRSYGALTTEYFAALGRGSVTLRDLGFQTVTTIQKFGGWLGAGAALYTALGGISAIGKGAIDSASGVNQLQRVVNNVSPEGAQGKFRDLAKEFNLPISDVSDAAYQMGKVFHDQNKAFEASRSVLYAVKVGELDVASASRYLTAITQGFNLTAKDQQVVFDQVNRAQNRYNISINSLLAGTAKAAGSFRNAGGDATHLISLITALSKASGQTGDVIGTAIQRSPHFIGLEKNQAALANFGIDPRQPITKIYDDAIKVAQQIGPQRRRLLAEAIMGPQYGARVGIFLLNNADLYKKVLGDVSPEKSKGSAAKELSTTLGALSERLKAIVIDLEIMGSALNQAGFFDVFKGGLFILEKMLSLTGNLIELFDQLPKPMREFLVLALQAGAAIKLLRFFNVGQGFAEGSAGARIFTSPRQTQKLYGDALARESDTLGAGRESAANRAVAASYRVEVAQERLNAAKAAEAKLIQAGLGETEAGVAAKEATAAQQTKLDAAQVRVSEAEDERTIILRRQLANAEQQALLARARNAAEAEAIAGAYGVRIPTRVGSPDIPEAEKIQRQVNQGVGAGGPIILPSGTQVPREAVPGGQGAVDKLRAEEQSVASRIKAAAREGGLLRGGAEAANIASLAAYSKFSQAETSVRSFVLNLPKTAASIRSFATTMAIGGAFDLALGAFFLLPPILEHLHEGISKAQDELDQAASKTPKNVKQFDASVGNLTQGFKTDAITKLIGSGDELEQARADFALAMVTDRENFRQRLTQGKYGSGAKGDIFPSDIKDAMGDYVKRLHSGVYNAKEFDQAFRNLVHTAALGPWSDKQSHAIIHDLYNTLISTKGLDATYQNFAALFGKQLHGQIADFASLLQTPLGNDRDVRRLFQRVLPQVTEGLSSGSRKNRALAGQDLDSAIQGLQTYAQNELQLNLQLARGQRARNAAYADYFQTLDPGKLRNIYRGQRQDLQKQLHHTQAQIGEDRRALSTTPERHGLFGIELPGTPDPGTQKDLRERLDTAKGIRKSLGNLGRAQKLAIERIKAIIKEQSAARFQENQQIREAREKILEGRTADPYKQAKEQLVFLNREIPRAIKQYGRDSKEVLDLLGQRQEAIQQAVQAQYDQLQSNLNLGIARRFGPKDEIGQAGAEIARDQQLLAFMRSHSRQFDPKQIADLEAQIVDAQQQLAQDIYDQATQIHDAALEVRQARAEAAGNPVLSARFALQEAQYNLTRAQTPLEKLQARKSLIESRAALRDAINQREIDDIQFQADIGKLTLDQQVAAYQRLLHTLNLTRDARRDLRRRIHQLKQEADNQDFDLNVGNIKLPTIYEIKRAIAGGVGGGNQTTITQSNSIVVQANGADAGEVVAELNRTIGGANQSAMRAAGLA